MFAKRFLDMKRAQKNAQDPEKKKLTEEGHERESIPQNVVRECREGRIVRK